MAETTTITAGMSSLQAARRGREGSPYQILRFWARDGRAARIQLSWVGGRINGQCVACGHIFLGRVLIEGYRPDERAGQVVSAEDYAAHNLWLYQYDGSPVFVYAPLCGVRQVCPACAGEMGLEEMQRPFYGRGQRGQPRPHVCLPPGFVTAAKPLIMSIDLTQTGGAPEFREWRLP